ncbi:MAG: hypothetical protein B0A82_08505 [Alkalinema sp. CACIAM 70d]|nr:MAG: hypothetical protein B0A82_08505 [Alkalinema sp. CACIAM 70d]
MPLEGFNLQELQLAIADASASWLVERNEFTEMSSDERRQYLGYIPGPSDPSLEEDEKIAQENLKAFLTAPAIKAYPPSYDLRDVDGKNYITSIKNQGGCGACVAFGVAAAAEGRLRKQVDNPNLDVDYSEAHLFYCYARSEGRNCGNGWWISGALDAFRDSGVVDEACFPYTAQDQTCNLCQNWEERLTKITGWHALTSAESMKEWISTQGPLVTRFSVYEDFFAYGGGIYKHVKGGLVAGHCVCCVGYNDIEGYWICKNSWKDSFGENGYFRIAYGECGIDSSMAAIESVKTQKVITRANVSAWMIPLLAQSQRPQSTTAVTTLLLGR